MSMFRRPGDSSSDESDSDDRDDHNEDTEASQDDLDLLSRINTINSTSAQSGSGRQTPLSSRPAMSRNNSQLRDLLLHSLLEEKAVREAATLLGKDISDPEVRQRGRDAYKALSRQLSGSNDVDEKYSSDAMQQHRAAAQKGVGTAARGHLTGLSPATMGDSQALVLQTASITASGLLNVIPSPIQLLLKGFPGLYTSDHYAKNFVQLDVVGKGGYGKVFKVQHRLDNFLYAVKRITISPARLQRMHENGPKEMEKLLEEVRALARFDHGNIVRYHNAWLEFMSGPVEMTIPAVPSPVLFPNGRLIQDASSANFHNIGELSSGLNDLSFGDQFGNSGPEDDGIVFEDSSTGAGAQESENESSLQVPDTTFKRSKRRTSRASQASYTSQATHASVSSSHSRKTIMRGDNGEDDEDVETIPRTSDPSESMLSDRYVYFSKSPRLMARFMVC